MITSEETVDRIKWRVQFQTPALAGAAANIQLAVLNNYVTNENLILERVECNGYTIKNPGNAILTLNTLMVISSQGGPTITFFDGISQANVTQSFQVGVIDGNASIRLLFTPGIGVFDGLEILMPAAGAAALTGYQLRLSFWDDGGYAFVITDTIYCNMVFHFRKAKLS